MTTNLQPYLPMLKEILRFYLVAFRKAILNNKKNIPKSAYKSTREVKDIYQSVLLANSIRMNHDEVRKILACVLFYGSRHSQSDWDTLKMDKLEIALIKMFKATDDTDDIKRISYLIHRNSITQQTILQILRM